MKLADLYSKLANFLQKKKNVESKTFTKVNIKAIPNRVQLTRKKIKIIEKDLKLGGSSLWETSWNNTKNWNEITLWSETKMNTFLIVGLYQKNSSSYPHLTLLSKWAHLQRISTQAPPTIAIKPQQPTNKKQLHCPHTYTSLLPLDRYPVPASPHNLLCPFSWDIH